MMKFFIVTAFPAMFDGVLNESILKRAQEKGIAEISTIDLRNYAEDKHKTLDDYPFGGGAGMLLKPEPIFKCVEDIINKNSLVQPRIILTSAAGEKFDQACANSLKQEAERALIIICGHYKGIDERVRASLATDEISIGDYILTGGELAAMIITDAVVRLLPGVIGDAESAATDSFQSGLLEFPQYTRPSNFRGMMVPEILLSGHHKKIQDWRYKQSLKATKEKRKALYLAHIEKCDNKT